jgi:hypothetical protein
VRVIHRGYGIGMSTVERQNDRAKAADITRTRGTSLRPQAPRDVFCQAGPQGLLVTWNYPAVNFDIQGWRIYKGDENTLYAQIKDRGTRSWFVSSTNAVPVNILISAVNAAGVESPKTVSQGTPGASTIAMPTVPAEFNNLTASDLHKNVLQNYQK